MNRECTYQILLLVLLLVMAWAVFGQRDVVLHHRDIAAQAIQNEEFDKVIFARDVYVRSLNDTVRLNLLRIWEREMISLFKGDFKQLLQVIAYNDLEFFTAREKRTLIKWEYRGYYPYHYVEQNLRNDLMNKVIFEYLKQHHVIIQEAIQSSDAINAEEQSFLQVYLQLYVYYAKEHCPEHIFWDLLKMAKQHEKRFPFSLYKDFITNYILEYSFPSDFSAEGSLTPIGYYSALTGELSDDIRSQLNFVHMGIGRNYKNIFVKVSAGFSFLRFNGYHDPDDELGIPGFSGQFVIGYELHSLSNPNWTFSPFIGINYMLYRDKLLSLKKEGVIYEDLSPIIGINIEYSKDRVKRCMENSYYSRRFHRLQIGFSPMLFNRSGHENGFAMQLQYSFGNQRNIKRQGISF
jgi:hypothetical protein